MNTPITAERLQTFVWLVRVTRDEQREYRRTIDARLRYSVKRLEEQLDAEAEQFAADLAELGAVTAGEGGVA